jgi:hypothetical protein
VAQQALAVVLAAGVQQEVQASFFFAKMHWPLEAQLLSRRLVETRARVRSDFMMMWFECLETGSGLMTYAQPIRVEIKHVISGNLKIKCEFGQSEAQNAGMKKPGRVASGLGG